MFRKIAVAAGLLAAAIAGPAQAQDYPEKPIEFIVPWGPGGGSDTLMRIVAMGLSEVTGQAVPIVNMPGVGGTVGLAEFAKRPADGYTISQIHEGLYTANKLGITELSYKNFIPVALVTSSPQYLVLSKNDNFSNLEELKVYAAANPGAVRAGVTLGGVPHLHMAMIEEALGVQFSYVGFRDTGERIRAAVGGNVDIVIGDVASASEFVKNGDLIFAGVGTEERTSEEPDVPTMAEQGYDLSMAVTRGVVLPAGTPDEIVEALDAALEKAMSLPDIREKMTNAGSADIYLGREAYKAYLDKLDGEVDKVVGKLQG
ncbi:tripartite tricarboxylate transporter substrate binding protein [Thalassospira sp. A40-3]|uniref:tripartite tricarboxylate transporter substrate binding protein n=1 Tax=Thalassospira sp. A40-3 TaxID=2785908 RepID=UPI0018CE308F|nr:tripartite tricarboxylate transporter substrate binding protein [Thalassospira sp. A40-3]QPO11668.1 tripartite tricarboxylate transporter substrate binding protein [Thalassospira sp. A40-3]